MQRLAGIAIVALTAVVIIQFAALRRMRMEISRLRVEAVAMGLEARKDEIARTGAWLHAWLQTPEGGSRPGGLCPGGAPDVDTIRRLIFGTYLQVRAGGTTEMDARGSVVNEARK
jgi:hypothetical protein